MNLFCKYIICVILYIHAPAVKTHRFFYSGKIIFCCLYCSSRKNTPQSVGIFFISKSTVNIILVFMKIIKTKRVLVGLVAPYHRRNSNAHAHYINYGVALISPQIAEHNFEIIFKHCL